MARTVTRLQLQTRIYQRANMENHLNAMPASEVQDVVNEVLPEIWDLLVAASPPDYYSSETTFTTVSGTLAYALPSDFYKARAVWVSEGGNEYRPIDPYNEAERQVYRPPDGAYSVLMRYIHVCPTLASDGTTFDGVNGWDELAVICGAIKLLMKEASRLDVVQLLMSERARQEKRIMDMAERDVGAPQRVIRRAGRANDPFRIYTSSINAYQLVGANIHLVRVAGEYAT